MLAVVIMLNSKRMLNQVIYLSSNSTANKTIRPSGDNGMILQTRPNPLPE
jgi:hypothetical protein